MNNWYNHNHDDDNDYMNDQNQIVTLKTINECKHYTLINFKLKQSGKLPFYLNEKTTWFKLPSNLTSLNHMTPLEYLKSYVCALKLRLVYLKNLFNKHKYEESLIRLNRSKDFVFKDNMLNVLRELSQFQLNTKELDEFVDFLDLNSVNEFDLNEFLGLILFSEIYFYKKFFPFIQSTHYNCVNERLDFNYLFTKFDSKLINTNKKLYNLLKLINDFLLEIKIN
jgi:hypothetical protein